LPRMPAWHSQIKIVPNDTDQQDSYEKGFVEYLATSSFADCTLVGSCLSLEMLELRGEELRWVSFGKRERGIFRRGSFDAPNLQCTIDQRKSGRVARSSSGAQVTKLA
jgi:hypothetical protein